MPKGHTGDYLTHVKQLGEKTANRNAKYKLKYEFLKMFDAYLKAQTNATEANKCLNK